MPALTEAGAAAAPVWRWSRSRRFESVGGVASAVGMSRLPDERSGFEKVHGAQVQTTYGLGVRRESHCQFGLQSGTQRFPVEAPSFGSRLDAERGP